MTKNKTLIEAPIRITIKGVGRVTSDEGADIEIAPGFLATALPGDTVRVKLLPGASRFGQPGEVLEIVKRARTQFVGVIKNENNEWFVAPDDLRIYANFLIAPAGHAGATTGDKVLVQLTAWPPGDQNPTGKVIKVIGRPGEHETEMRAIVFGHGFELDFPAAVEQEANKLKDASITSADTIGRRDFRSITTFTIDPDDAKDFDDAISLRPLPDGNYEVGVHIADVSHYVRPGTALDAEAIRRGTSIYLVDRTIPMLPEVLSNDLCSLVANQDRLTYSAVFTLTPAGDLVAEWFGRTIIHSARRFSYEAAQKILDDGRGVWYAELNILNQLAGALRRKKIEAGAITFPDEEIKFSLDEAGRPIDIYKKVRLDTHLLVEDFMLLANKKVAEFASRQAGGRPGRFVYRIHDVPNRDKLKILAEFVRPLGYSLDARDGIARSRDLNTLLNQVAGSLEQNMIHTAAVRAMAKAVYSIKNIGHYGLAFPHYTHFTSPIRRYPDLMVHRLLSLYLAGEKPSDELMAEYDRLSIHASDREQLAAAAERDSIKYKQVEYLQNKIGEVRHGVISGLAEWGMFIEDLATKAEGLVRLRDLGDDYYVFDEKNYCFVGRRTKKKYRLGDPIKMKVARADLARKQLDYILVR